MFGSLGRREDRTNWDFEELAVGVWIWDITKVDGILHLASRKWGKEEE